MSSSRSTAETSKVASSFLLVIDTLEEDVEPFTILLDGSDPMGVCVGHDSCPIDLSLS